MVLPELPFSIEGESFVGPGSYRPILSKSSGIITPWLLFGISALVWCYLYLRGFTPPPSLWIPSVIMLLVALATSFNYWLEKQTVILIEEQGVCYQSPLRRVTLHWAQIHELWCHSFRGGWRFTISDSAEAFRFVTLKVLQFGSGREVCSGFIDGKRIAQLVQQRADLRVLERQDRVWIYRKQDRNESS